MIVGERYNADLQVTLYLDKQSDGEIITIAVSDAGDTFILTAKDRAEAVEMFHHPFAYHKPEVEYA